MDVPRCDGMGHAYGDRAMMDIVFIVATVGFFVAAIAYVHACERL
jgi:hypothetical protein